MTSVSCSTSVFEIGNTISSYASISSNCQFNFESKGASTLGSNGIITFDPSDKSITFSGLTA